MKRAFRWSAFGLMLSVLLAMVTCVGGGGDPQQPVGFGFFYGMMLSPFIIFVFFIIGFFVDLVTRVSAKPLKSETVQLQIVQRTDKLISCPKCGNSESVDSSIAHRESSYQSFTAKDSYFFTSMVFICNSCSSKFRG